MRIADIFSTKMSGSCTLNYIPSFSIFKALTFFISHCFACHQWQAWIEPFTGCLPKCLLWARPFLPGLHPTYHFSIKKDYHQTCSWQATSGKQRSCKTHSQAGQRRHAHSQGNVRRAGELWFFPVVQLTEHRTLYFCSWDVLCPVVAQWKHWCQCPSSSSSGGP